MAVQLVPDSALSLLMAPLKRFLGVNLKVIASLTYYMMSLEIYKQVKEEGKEEKSRAALALSSGRKL
ncbi:hypothetical protein Cadr_000026747 [Camelus dromedarius]|uniref:Uncharacterized protein n=1 Tax=Camelus dromedarius TaxID=9838 RepID=A0A5N4C5G3_CAMDR|nr:hypothetical protein Cadr_000026747 [Camelus dromedarius]